MDQKMNVHWTYASNAQEFMRLKAKLENNEGIILNNEAYQARQNKDYKTALEKYQKAVALKIEEHGEESVHTCISLSGLCEVYLEMGDAANAMKETKRFLNIAKVIKDQNQIRIAKEILADILKL